MPCVRVLRVLCKLSLCALAACTAVPLGRVLPQNTCGFSSVVVNTAIDAVDLLVVMDNADATSSSASHRVAQLDTLIRTLISPPCKSWSDLTVPLHECDPANPNDVPAYRAVQDLHLGVVSADLGTAGHEVPGCDASSTGEDGLFDPHDAGPQSTRPRFLSYHAGEDVERFVRDFRTRASDGSRGCTVGAPLEAAWRALFWHGAWRPVPQPGEPPPALGTTRNAGFLREDALLVILVLTADEDGSVQDCRYATNPLTGLTSPCDPTRTDVYDPASRRWASDTDLRLRFSRYQQASQGGVGGPRDPTWDVDRYVDPDDPEAGFLALKPGHPERVLFAVVAGVPHEIPMAANGSVPRVNWDALLGPPGVSGPDDFAGRDLSRAFRTTTPQGEISLRQEPDPQCPDRNLPACYDPRSSVSEDRTCRRPSPSGAWPGRRLLEVARRFDQSERFCWGGCRNGTIASICGGDPRRVVQPSIERVQLQLGYWWIPRLRVRPGYHWLDDHLVSSSLFSVDCSMREIEVERARSTDPLRTCDPELGRHPPAVGRPRWVRILGADETPCTEEEAHRDQRCRTVCLVAQVPLVPHHGTYEPVTEPFADGSELRAPRGWYYRPPNSRTPFADRALDYTLPGGAPPDSWTVVECVGPYADGQEDGAC